MKDKNNNNHVSGEETKIYLTPDSTLQTPEEAKHDKEGDPYKNDHLEVSRDDLHTTNADRFVGSDRAGTAERKDNDMDESNDDEEAGQA